MYKIQVLLTLLIFSKLLFAQQDNEVQQFDKVLNQFNNVRDFCISETQDEAYFTIQSMGQEISQLACIKKEKDTWQEPVLLPFCNAFIYMEPFLSADGLQLYFVSDRPLNDKDTIKKDFDIWYVERSTKTGPWSDPINLGAPVNTNRDEFYPSLSSNKKLYFTKEAPEGLGKDDIYYSKWENGNYTSPTLLDESINSSGYEFNAYISKQEDFIIFSKYNESDGQGSGDLYIAKKDSKGVWTKAENLGLPINSKYMEYCPYFDEQQELLYFTSKRNSISAQNFKSIAEFQNYLRENENGLSKIYKTRFRVD